MNQFLIELSIQVIATVLGGILLALVFFWVRDKFYPLPALSGLWTLEAKTVSSAYRPYQDMRLTYLVLLAQGGNQIHGTGEKVQEQTSHGTRRFVGKHRVEIEVTGHITKRYFSADELVVHIHEFGKERSSSTVQTVKVLGDDRLEGTFISTIADSSGEVLWTRGSLNFSFTTKT